MLLAQVGKQLGEFLPSHIETKINRLANQPLSLGRIPEPYGGNWRELVSVNKSLRLLIVEDHDDLRQILCTFSEGFG